MSNLSLDAIATGATQAQIVSTLGLWRTAIQNKINNGLVGGASGSGNNVQEDAIYRVNVRDETKTNTFIGEIFQEDLEIRASGGTVAKVSGVVFSVSDATWYIHDTGSDPDQARRVRKTSIANDSVLANRDTYLDIGIDETIDKNDVANGAVAPAVAANHFRFAKVEASAQIHTITMLGNTKYKNNSWPSRGGLDTVRIVSPVTSASAATTITVQKGARVRDQDDTFNISVAANINAVITDSGAGGLDTGAESASTWYAIHLIGDSNGSNTPSLLLSKSGTAPTMPSGYNKSKRIGWVRNNGSSHFMPGVWHGRQFISDRMVNLLTNGSATVYTNVDMSSVVPSTGITAVLYADITGASAFRFRRDGANNDDGPEVLGQTGGTKSSNLEVALGAARVVEYKRVSGTADLTLNFLGYVDAPDIA